MTRFRIREVVFGVICGNKDDGWRSRFGWGEEMLEGIFFSI